ncbi:MAG: bifunctional diaminohydroxyphosphoribosylaminopyrimidine deaminase/5-amino-6-(5-phosphoribosylamino)uracil reductase RibD, partial [Geminicoccaceae bacterium]|nr:bifunctional diaminohydroxyphosphoribosylaminopyrimidine deaminase/5-amino-6-(5-phosphoribosylamino)uracil reductase RibD [Geminicoccaceae bacterium]
MGLALALGERHLGLTAPNPSVGCVIVRDGLVVGRGWTQPGGRPHAEAEALARAGDAARGATAYVTLEPCSNWGKTPPCTKGLIEAGIARVVVGCVDPDPRVDGKGIAGLREAGLEVVVGVREAEALAQNLGLYRRIRAGRPMVGLKLAMSLDGRIATRTGDSQWITGEAARAFGHRLRASHDAIMIGSGTALADDPLLTCRLPGLEGRSPVRVVMDRRGRLPATSQLRASADRLPLVHVTAADGDTSPGPVLTRLADQGITRLLVEGGASLATSLLEAGLVDRLYVFSAPALIGGDGLAAIQGLGVDRMADVGRWRVVDTRLLG